MHSRRQANALTSLGFLMLALGLQDARSAVLTVDILTDELAVGTGRCSLREAIIATNNNADSNDCVASGAYDPNDTINISPTGTLTLSRAGVGEDLAATGDLDILGPVRIVGNGTGAGGNIIEANGIDRVFDIRTTSPVRIESVVLQGGKGFSFGGGGIRMATVGSSLTLATVVVQNNDNVTAQTPSNGGGVLNNGGTLTATSTDFFNNKGLSGAGYAGQASTAVFTNCNFNGNATSTGAGGGGISDSVGAQTTIHGGTFIANHANVGGGAIVTVQSTLTIDQGTTFTSNDANDPNSVGGAIDNQQSTVTLTGALLNLNRAAIGGAVYNTSGFSIGNLTLNACVLANNGATLRGGAIANERVAQNDANLTVNNGTVTSDLHDNTASDGSGGGLGGGIYNTGTATLNGTLLRNNAAGKDGGGIYNTGSTTAQSGTVIGQDTSNRNTAGRNGGGVYNSGSFTLDGSSASFNLALEGGGVYTAGGTLQVQNGSNISTNSAAGLSGTGGFGGGIRASLTAGGTVAIDHSTIAENSAKDTGSVNGSGGGLYLETADAGTVIMTLTDSTVGGGNSARLGGGISFSGPAGSSTRTLLVTRSTLSGNLAAVTGGGGVYNAQGVVTLVNSTVSGNTAPAGSGAGIFSDGGNGASTRLANVTVASNTSQSNGGGLHVTGATLQSVLLKNSLLAKNSPSDCSQEVASSIGSQGYNLADDSSCNLIAIGDKPNTDPNLGSLASNGGPTQTHALPAGSQALDMADPSGCTDFSLVLLTTDQRGSTRPSDGDSNGSIICDMGAFELLGGTPTPTPTATDTSTPTVTATATITHTPTETLTDTRTATPTGTFTRTATATPTSSATVSETASATRTATSSPTATATPPVIEAFGSSPGRLLAVLAMLLGAVLAARRRAVSRER